MFGQHLQEPELEFGGGGRHVDIRFGLTAYGPRDCESAAARKQINVGLIGTNDNVEVLAAWLSRCAQGVQPKRSRQPNLFPMFPGFVEAFKSELIVASELYRIIGSSAVDRVVGFDHDSSVQAAVD